MAPGLLSVGMGPTVHDVRGAPVPGLSGVAPRPVPGAVRFEDLLRGLAPARPGRPPATPPVQRRLPLAPGAPHAASPPAGSRPALVAAIRHAAGTAGVDSALSLAVARAESNLDPQARSTDGLSVGTFQVTQATAAEMRRKIAAGIVSRTAGPEDVALGVGYLRYLDDIFGRRSTLAPGLATVPVWDGSERRLFTVAAYNAGEGRVARAQARAGAAGGDPTRFTDVRRFLPGTTQGYVDRVVAYARAETAATAVG